MRKDSGRLCLVIGILALVLVTGCRQIEETQNPVSETLVDIGATSPPSERNTSTELQRIQFDDIPVPPGFFLRNHRNESYSFRQGDTRIGRFVYWGRGHRQELQAFFRENMSKSPYLWGNKDITNQESLEFEKSDDHCRVLVEPDRLDTQNGMLITITVNT